MGRCKEVKKIKFNFSFLEKIDLNVVKVIPKKVNPQSLKMLSESVTNCS